MTPVTSVFPPISIAISPQPALQHLQLLRLRSFLLQCSSHRSERRFVCSKRDLIPGHPGLPGGNRVFSARGSGLFRAFPASRGCHAPATWHVVLRCARPTPSPSWYGDSSTATRRTREFCETKVALGTDICGLRQWHHNSSNIYIYIFSESRPPNHQTVAVVPKRNSLSWRPLSSRQRKVIAV